MIFCRNCDLFAVLPLLMGFMLRPKSAKMARQCIKRTLISLIFTGDNNCISFIIKEYKICVHQRSN